MTHLKSFLKRRPRNHQSPLLPWMHFVLRFAGWYNLTAGLMMILLCHQGFRFFQLEKTEFMMPIQLVGVLVAIFGVGYLLTDRNPQENQTVLYLGFLSKALGPLISLFYIANGMLPIWFLIVLFFADTIYLFPFWKIYWRLETVLNGNRDSKVREDFVTP